MMRKTATIIGCLLIGSSVCFGAEPKSIDLRKQRDEATVHSIVFLARAGLPGHAFVAFGSDSKEDLACLSRAFGFYPDGGKGVVGPVPGQIVDESRKAPGETLLILKVDRKDFEKAEAIRAAWTRKRYKLRTSDCNTYVIETAKALGLKVPDRGATDLPIDWVRKLTEAN